MADYFYICKINNLSWQLKKKFVINLAFLLLLNLLIKPFWIFGIDRTVQNSVGTGVYGIYFVLFNLSVILNILLDIGITNYNNKTIAQNPSVLVKYVPNIIGLKVILSLLYGIICLLVGLILHFDSHRFSILGILVFNQVLASFILYLRSNISGLQMFMTDSVISVLDRFVMIIICSLLLWTDIAGKPFKIEWFVYSQTVSYSISFLTALAIVISKTGMMRIRFQPHFYVALLKQSFPFALLILLMAVYNRVDSVMLDRMLGNEGKVEAGIYAQAFRLLDAFSMFGFLFAGLLLPMFARMISQAERIEGLLKLSFLLIFIPSVILCISCWTYKGPIMHLLYKENVDQSAIILSCLMTGFLGISVSYIFGTLLTASGNLWQLNIMAGISLILNIVLNIILIPHYKALGSAVSSMSTQVFAAIAQLLIARKLFKLGLDLILLLKLALFVVLMIAFSICSVYISGNWILNIGLLFTCGFIIATLFGLFRFSGLIQLLKENPMAGRG
jgi:O-antigen/teichoic acid export membrane protein